MEGDACEPTGRADVANEGFDTVRDSFDNHNGSRAIAPASTKRQLRRSLMTVAPQPPRPSHAAEAICLQHRATRGEGPQSLMHASV